MPKPNEIQTMNIGGNAWGVLFRLINSDWVALILQAWRLLRAITTEQAIGLYEVLDFEHMLELCDTRGKKAIYHKRETVRFLQDFVTAYEDQAWGRGQVFADYKCSPGVPVDRYRDGHKYRVLISLREIKRRGDVMRINIDRTVRNGFMVTEGWSETDVSHRMKRLSIGVIFPKERRCRQMWLIEKNAGRVTSLEIARAELLPDGRQRIVWERKKPVLFETYALKWVW
jgi:hypothetical protein